MLANKVSELRGGAEKAIRIADFWDTQIERHGEPTAEAFYKSLGLNHLEKKSIEWEGLILSREPTEAEKLCIKSIAGAQDAGKASVSAVLLEARTALIDEALKAIKKLKPANYHELILSVPDKFKSELRDQLGKVFMKGKKLVDAELTRQAGKSFKTWCPHLGGLGPPFICEKCETKQADPTAEDDQELDDVTDLTDGRMANEIQARITAAAARFALLGLTGKALWDAVNAEVGDGSTGWLDRIATGATNNVLNFGRSSEAAARQDEWGTVEYSAILDNNVCDPCAAADGESGSSEDDLTPAPNPECAGGDWCRCFHVFVMDTVA